MHTHCFSKYELYQMVSRCEGMAGFIKNVFSDKMKREAVVLREDFSVTGWLCSDWVEQGGSGVLVGEAAGVQWGLRNNPWADSSKQRLRFYTESEKPPEDSKADITTALDFHWCRLLTDSELLAYFTKTRKNSDSLLLDLYGGTSAESCSWSLPVLPSVRYTYSHTTYSPCTEIAQCSLTFPPTSLSFSFTLRLRTPEHLFALLQEAGFASVCCYSESPSGAFTEVAAATATAGDYWVMYLVAY
eukprot:TRINITY_DN14563_c4_g1_i2.p1 TRINITY_DN14563_c4_g1~~TRINITY_DN14563_c4_g1_i2.p1  ORF type:complete len:244 (+),score=21.83 TRINITY_DN14563_c4_g1_i2:70-801(+)